MNRRSFLVSLGTFSCAMALNGSAFAAKKALVVYFSKAGEQYGVGVIAKGNTAIAAEILAQKIGADLCEISVQNDTYPPAYKDLCNVAKRELNRNARPAYKKTVADVSAYEVLFIGAPVWWGDWPMVLYSFFEQEDLAGKTLIPFNTHAGSGLAGFDRKLAKVCQKSKVADGLAILGADAQKRPNLVKEQVDAWLKKLAKQGLVF